MIRAALLGVLLAISPLWGAANIAGSGAGGQSGPGGQNTEVQFNDNSTLGGSSSNIFDKNTGIQTLNGGVDVLCTPAANNCGMSLQANASDCLSNGAPPVGTCNICVLGSTIYKHCDTDSVPIPVGLGLSLASRSADVTFSATASETILSQVLTAQTPLAFREFRVLTDGQVQDSSPVAINWRLKMGHTGATTTVLDLPLTPGGAVAANTGYQTNVLCTIRSAGSSGTVQCGGSLAISGIAPAVVSTTSPVTVDLSGTPVIETYAKFASNTGTINWTEKNIAVLQDDPVNLVVATTSTSTSSTTTSTSTSTSSTIAGGSNPLDWTSDAKIVALYNFEASPPDGTASRCSGGGANCDLTTITGGPITASTGVRGTDFTYGSQAASLAATQDIKRTVNATLGFSGAQTIAAWIRFPGATANNADVFATNFTTTNNGIRLYFPSFDSGKTYADIGEGTGFDTRHASGALTTNTWYFDYAGARAGGGPGELGAVGYFKGAATVVEGNVTQATGDMVNSTTVGNIGFNDTTLAPTTVLVDEAVVSNVFLTQMSLCRICSCGLDGAHPPDGSSACTCSGTAWNTKGANATMCGGCTLDGATEACNAASPASR